MVLAEQLQWKSYGVGTNYVCSASVISHLPVNSSYAFW